MHPVVRQPEHKFGSILKVCQVMVLSRTRAELYNGGRLGKHATLLIRLHRQHPPTDECGISP
eukprot:5562873-Prymnesium_polylepis.1